MAVLVFGQIEKGDVQVAGSLSFSSISKSGSNNSSILFTVAPAGLFYVSDNFAVGAELSYTIISQSGDSESVFAGGPVLKYSLTSSSAVVPFFQVGVIFTSTSNDRVQYDAGKVDYPITSSNFAFAIGFDQFINENIAITPRLSYLISSRSGSSDINTLSLGIGFSMFL